MRSVVVLPTYNERNNVDPLLRAISAVELAPGDSIDVLVVDDSSPDGTANAVRELSSELGRITVLDRPAKEGLGSAYRHGFAEVLEADFDVIISMDADLSHDPTVIPTMLADIANGSDAVVGSRYVPGGRTADWPAHRRLLSRWGNAYTRAVLRLPTRDCTSGFRAYTSEALAAIEPTSTRAEGYAFLTELIRRLSRTDHLITETPIVFRDREQGTSKMSGRIVIESMWLVTAWAVKDVVARR